MLYVFCTQLIIIYVQFCFNDIYMGNPRLFLGLNFLSTSCILCCIMGIGKKKTETDQRLEHFYELGDINYVRIFYTFMS